MAKIPNIVKDRDKNKWAYSGYGIAFDCAGLWGFSNEFARNVIISGVDNSSSSSHADNHKNNVLVLAERPTDNINGSVGAAEKKLTINFSKTKTIFFKVCIAIMIIVFCLLTEKKSVRLKPIRKTSTFQFNFVFENM